jgi:phospholipid/cholesterol/gamma-HCH transport system substrate-binding protein
MARRLSWSDVRGGALAVVGIVVLAGVIIKYSRLGTLHGDTFELYALVGEARGLLRGSEVWLSGQKIGKVIAIEFRSPSLADTSARLELRMQILERFRANVHRDAIAQIRPGGSIVGSPVVYLTPGTLAAATIQPGDTVKAAPQSDAETAAGQFAVASKEFPVIINNVKVLAAQLQGTRGSAGAFLNAPGGSGLPSLAATKANMGRLADRMNGGGTVGRFMQGGVTDRAARVMARVDSIRALVASPNTSLGRFRKDSTLFAEVADIRNEITLVRASINSPDGTVGRALHDSAITDALADAGRQMKLLMADIKKHPLRYLVF